MNAKHRTQVSKRTGSFRRHSIRAIAIVCLLGLTCTVGHAAEPADEMPKPEPVEEEAQPAAIDKPIDEEAASLRLNGETDYVEIPRDDRLMIDDSITIEVGFLTRAPAGELPLLSNPNGNRSSRGNYCLRLLKSGHTARIEFGFEPQTVIDHVFVTKLSSLREDFNHVAVCFRYGDGPSIRVYLNGELLPGWWKQGDGNIPPRPNDGPLWVGRAQGGTEGWWQGNIRDLAVWNAIRTPEQLVASMKAPLQGTEQGLVGYWPFVEDVADACPLGNNGIMHGKPQFGPPAPPLEAPTLRPALRGSILLPLRKRVETFNGLGIWDEAEIEKEFPVAETAILLCDVWDKHWCKSATKRLNAMIPRMNTVVERARKQGIQIIHAPSETMGFYTGTPYRLRSQMAPSSLPPEELDISAPPLPIDASDGGCDDQPQCRQYRAWKRQHPGIDVMGYDAVSDSGREIYNLMKQLGIKNVIIMGVHTNMCVLGRSFGIRQMTRWGVRCVLIRDLTDAMYNPRMEPMVPHNRGTELVVEHIEKYWCPTILSEDLLEAMN